MFCRLINPIKQINLKLISTPSTNLMLMHVVEYQQNTKRRFAEKKTATFSRPTRLETSPPIVLGFLPYEWFEFFFKRTGVSGFGTFLTTFSIYLLSKEKYVCEHEFYNGLSMLMIMIYATKTIGPGMAKFIDDQIDEFDKTNQKIQDDEKQYFKDGIQFEQEQQLSQEAQLVVVKAKQENVHLQLEAAYRERLMSVYNETRKRLEYCVVREEIERAIAQRNMASWVIKNVKDCITKEIEERALSQCMEDLKALASFYTSGGSQKK